ncbi:putative mediator of RNA polymerase II transcription subunit 12 [Zophobas morio]|uniref:putative mediator of RNA polymerase II transcription subunit 12 n=1 Tax=Zophobas morio TaxID=2755281 RepID=UPI003083AFEF
MRSLAVESLTKEKNQKEITVKPPLFCVRTYSDDCPDFSISRIWAWSAIPSNGIWYTLTLPSRWWRRFKIDATLSESNLAVRELHGCKFGTSPRAEPSYSVLLVAIGGNCQLLRDEERPTRYVLPYSGLTGGEEPEVADDKHYYKPNRRAERIPATAYQYDEAEEEYYRPQPQPRPKAETESYRYQPTTPSHKDYEEILKHNHLVRLRVAAKKQSQPPTPQQQQQQQQQQPQQPVEQYLKEVNPTTKTAYQRPSNYLRFNSQSAVKQEQSEETPLKQQSYRYILQPELQQQKPYPQYQYEPQQESPKSAPKTPHFNLVAYQNALIAQQKLLAAENQDGHDSPSKSAIYVSQSVKKSKKQKTTPTRPTSTQQYEYYPQVPPQRPTYAPESASSRYQQPLTPRNVYPKNENFQVEDSLLYPEPKELEYQTQAPTRATKQRTTRLPRRKPKYQPTEEPQEEYHPVSKYQDEQYDYQPSLKYQDEPAYRRPLPRPTKPSKYEDQGDGKDEYLYQPVPKYQRERESLPRESLPRESLSRESLSRESLSRESLPRDSLPRESLPRESLPRESLPRRQQPQYAPEPEVRPSRYLSRQQYQEESKQLPQYQSADLAYQPSAEVAVRQTGRGPSVSYRQELQNSSVRYYRNLGNPTSYVE